MAGKIENQLTCNANSWVDRGKSVRREERSVAQEREEKVEEFYDNSPGRPGCPNALSKLNRERRLVGDEGLVPCPISKL
jgi:hypothetical protein